MSMNKIDNYQYRTITLSEFDYLINKTVVAKYKIINDYKYELIFDSVKIFQKPNAIYFSSYDGTFFCIRNISMVEESDSIFRVHINKYEDKDIITIIPINTI